MCFHCSVFIREVKKRIRAGEKSYDYVQHRLVESVRTANGPRQRTVLNLGTLEINKDKYKDLANTIEAILNKDKQCGLFDTDPEIAGLARHFAGIILRQRLQAEPSSQEKDTDPPRYETVDVNSFTASDGRSVSLEHIALTQLRQLGFFDILDGCGFTESQQRHAAALVCARLVHPDSERETAKWLRETSAMDELLDTDFSSISDQTLHRSADRLYAQRELIEKGLSEKSTDLFSLDDSLVFYDLTNSYFESPKQDSAIAKYAKSKEKRNDCPLITLGLVVDAQGFPKKSRIYEGNVAEGGTLFDILEELGKEEGAKPRTVIIDAGIATEENLERLREDKRFEYVAVSRKKMARELFEGAEAKEIAVNRKKRLTVKALRQEDEVFLLCASEDREAKEKAMFADRKYKFEKGLRLLNAGLTKPRTQKKYDSILERIGRLKQKFKMGNFYTINVTKEEEKATSITWTFLKDNPQEPGEYILRTSRKDLSDEQISMLHRTLTMIESSFRWIKMSLGMRPNYHQLDKRMSAHVFISVLAYFVMTPILHKLHWGGNFVSAKETKREYSDWEIPYGWNGIAGTMASQTRVTSSFLCEDNQRMDVRTTLEPTAKQRELYRRLSIPPKPLKRIIVKQGGSH